MNLFHFLVPHHKNNHRAKLLHNASLLTLILIVSFISSLTVFIHKSHPDVLGISYQITESELLNLTNYERAQAGLKPLALNNKLNQAASSKADYMFLHNFWAHFAPDGTTPWQFIKDAKYEYVYAGENLAKGFTSSTDAIAAWMDSPTHKANILSDKYSEIGFSIKEGRLQGEDTVLIVQMFGEPLSGVIEGNIPDVPRVAPQVNGSEVQLPSVENNRELTASPLINITFVTKTITFLLLSVLLIALVLDFVVIKKKNIPRSVGNNLDHIILVTVFIAFVVIAKLGSVI